MDEVKGVEPMVFDYSSVAAPAEVIPYDVESIYREQYEKDKPSLGDTMSASFYRSQTIPAISGIVSRASQWEDESFIIDQDMKDVIDRDYSTKESEYLTSAKNQEDFNIRVKDIQKDRERDQILARSGATGLIAPMAMSLLDPVTWATGFGTGKILGAAKGVKAFHTAKVAALNGIENAAIEGILAFDNTQMTGTDILVAAGTGALFGAGTVTLQKGLGAGVSKLKSRGATEVQEGFKAAGERAAFNEAAAEMQGTSASVKAYPDGDVRAAQAGQAEHREGLVKKARGSSLTGKTKAEKAEIIKAIREEKALSDELIGAKKSPESPASEAELLVQKRIDDLSVKLESAKSGRKGIKKKIDKLKGELGDAKVRGLDPEFKLNIKRLEDSLAEATARRVRLIPDHKEAKVILGDYNSSTKAQADLKAWDNTPEMDRLNRLYPDGIDNIRDKSRAEIVSADELLRRRAEVDAQYDRGVQAGLKQAKGETLTPEELEDLVFKREQDGTDIIPEQSGYQEPTEHLSVGASGTGFNPREVYGLTEERLAVAKGWVKVGEELDPDYISWLPKSGAFKELASVTTRLLNSASLGIRGLTSRLLDNPQGGKQAAKTLASQLPTNDRLIRAAGEGKYVASFEEHCRNNKISVLNIKEREAALSEFNRAVFKELDSPGSSRNPDVQEAADGLRKQIKEGVKLQKDAGYGKTLNEDPEITGKRWDDDFVPIAIDHFAIKNGISKYGEAKIRKMLLASFHHVAPGVRDLLADINIAKAKNAALTLKDKVNLEMNLEQAEAALRRLLPGANQYIFDQFQDDLMTGIKVQKRKTGAGLANELKPKLVDSEGLSMVDFIHNDLAQVMEGFTKEASANASLAQAGFSSRKALLEQISDVEKISINAGHNPDAIREEVELLDMMQKVAYGEPVDSFSGTVRNRVGMARKVVAMRDLAFSGASQVAEVGALTSKRAWGIVADSMSFKELFKPASMREGGQKFGKHVRADFAELDEAFGFVGEDHILYDNRVANELRDEASAKAWERRIGNAIDKASRLSTICSGMKNIQSGLEKMGLRSAAGTLKRMAFEPDFGKVLRKAEIDRAGWSDGFLEKELFPWMRENPGTAMYDGRFIRTFNFEKMPPEMQARAVTGLQRLAYADIQRSFLGELPKFIHGTIGKTVAQHRNFQIASLEKQLIHGIRHDHAAMSMLALHTTFTAGLATVIKAAHRNLGEEDGLEKFLDSLDPTDPKFYWSVFQNIGLFASLGIATDLMYSVGLIPEHYAEVGGFRTMSSTSIPVVGYAKDVANVPKTLFNLMQGEGVGEVDSEEEGEKFLKALHKAIPGLNMIGINQALDVLERQ